MAEEIGELKARITADLSGLQSGLTRAQNMMGGFGGRMKTVGAQVGKVGDALMGVSVVAAAGLGAGIKIASDFEGAMKEIEVRAGLTGDELEQVRAFALQMGADTAFSGQEAAEGLLQLLSSGNDLRESMELLKPVMDLAAASGLDLGYSADAATDIMAMFGLSTGYATDVVNLLSGAAGASSATTQDLIDALGNVGTVAAGFGYNISETISALAVLADNGMKGAEAGTRLKSALMSMHTNQDAIDALKELGVALYEPDGSTRPLYEVIDELKEAMKDMTDEQKISYLTRLGGAYGMTALGALLAGTPVQDMTAKIHDQATAAEVAGTMTDTFAGRLDALKGSVETVAVEALTPFMDNVLKPFIDEHLIPIVNKIGEWVKANPELTGQLVALAGVAAISGGAMKVLSWGITAVGNLVTVGGSLLTGLGLLADAVVLPLLPALIAAVGIAGAYAIITKAAQDAEAAAKRAHDAVTMDDVLPEGDPVAGNFQIDKSAPQVETSFAPSTSTVYLQPGPNLDMLATLGYSPSTALEALAQGGLKPDEALTILMAMGVNPSASLQSLVDAGILPSDVLIAAQQDGFGPNVTLAQYMTEGINASQYLQALLAEGLKVSVSVDVNSDGRAAARPVSGPRAEGGDTAMGSTYLIGENGPELWTAGANGFVTPMDVFSGGGGGGAPIIIQNLSIFANSVEELYDQIRGEAGRRGERMAYA